MKMDKVFNQLDEINKIDTLFKDKYEYYGMSEKIERWFRSIEKENEKDVYLNLMHNFIYYSRKNIIESLRKIHLKVLEFDSKVDYTLFFPMISKDGRTNHSYEIHNMYREANCLNKGCFIADINYALNNIPMESISNIVFIDDMMGTGNTIKESIKAIYEQYKEIFNKKVYLILLEVPEEVDSIKEEIKLEIGVDITILYLNRHKKAFSKNFIFDNNYLDEAKNIVKKYDMKLTKKEEEVLGYYNSEFLLSFYYDTPNNTIISLWKENDSINWRPPFSRSTKTNHKPAWMNNKKTPYKRAKQLKEEKNTRKNMNYKLNSIIKNKRG